MNAAMQADCEASCDEIVLTEVGRQNNQFYAELLIEMIGDKKNVGTALSTCFYGSKRSVKKRMDAIMGTTGRIRKLPFAALCAVLALTVMSGSVFAFSESQTEEPPTPHPVLTPTEEADDEEQTTSAPNQNHGHNQNHGQQNQGQQNQGQGNHGNNQHPAQSGNNCSQPPWLRSLN